MAERLSARSGIDPVLSPLMQELAASDDEGLAEAAMRVIAAQARYMQKVRRMELPLEELPAELFHAATTALKRSQDDLGSEAMAVCDRLRENHDEGERRIGQMMRLVMAMKPDASRALSVDHAGLSLFSTALAMACEQERDAVILSLGENQCARLAISLRAAGLEQSAVEQQFLYLHPEISLPEGFSSLRADRAVELLSAAASGTAH